MFLDASAIIAILADEPDARELLAKIDAAGGGSCCYSPLAAYEAVVGLARMKTVALYGQDAPIRRTLFDQVQAVVTGFLNELEAVEIPIGSDIGKVALTAARDFGRATGHPAQLNFGDCFAYACARSYGVRLLFKGGDFSRTDIEAA